MRNGAPHSVTEKGVPTNRPLGKDSGQISGPKGGVQFWKMRLYRESPPAPAPAYTDYSHQPSHYSWNSHPQTSTVQIWIGSLRRVPLSALLWNALSQEELATCIPRLTLSFLLRPQPCHTHRPHTHTGEGGGQRPPPREGVTLRAREFGKGGQNKPTAAGTVSGVRSAWVEPVLRACGEPV